jgi:hypothetical protein
VSPPAGIFQEHVERAPVAGVAKGDREIPSETTHAGAGHRCVTDKGRQLLVGAAPQVDQRCVVQILSRRPGWIGEIDRRRVPRADFLAASHPNRWLPMPLDARRESIRGTRS